jgi:arylsulfatase A-like enzyme
MGLTRDETTIATALSAVGYSCGVVGKWHLGAHETLHPLTRGFHSFFGHLGGGHRYFPDELTIQNSDDATDEAGSYRTWILKDHTPVKPQQYLTDEFSDASVRFINGNAETPFFLFLSYNAPHLPFAATQKYLDRFPNLSGKRKTYAAMVSAVDDGVGKTLSALREHGILDDTLVFFLSDNGGPHLKNASNNSPLKGGKSDVWEGGYRVPFAARYPHDIEAGSTYKHPVSSLDIFATIAELAHAPVSPDRPLDGVNLLPYLNGTDSGSPHDAICIRKFDQQRYAIRSGNKKLVIPVAQGAPHLYDLNDDIGETKNIASQEADTVDQLKKKLNAWTAELVDPTFTGLMQKKSYKSH